MKGRRIALSPPRLFLTDLLKLARAIPTIPVQRRMNLAALVQARSALTNRPSWPAIFIKAFAQVARDTPVLRRAYVKLPWPHLREYPRNVASIAVERDYQGEPAVFFGKISDPDELPLMEIHSRIRSFAESPLEDVKAFRQLLQLGRVPSPIRKFLLWLGLNLPRTRPNKFGTFGLSTYASLGSESLHPISPMTATMTYGVIDADGGVTVRWIYDHRVTDGAAIARALAKLESQLLNAIREELEHLSTIEIRDPESPRQFRKVG